MINIDISVEVYIEMYSNKRFVNLIVKKFFNSVFIVCMYVCYIFFLFDGNVIFFFVGSK